MSQFAMLNQKHVIVIFEDFGWGIKRNPFLVFSKHFNEISNFLSREVSKMNELNQAVCYLFPNLLTKHHGIFSNDLV